MKAIKFEHFILRIYDQYVEILKSLNDDVIDSDLFEVWDYLEENFKLPVPVLTTNLKCFSISSEAQLQLGKTAKNYYSAIAIVYEKNSDPNSLDKDLFLEDVQIEFYESKDAAINWLKQFGPVKDL